MYSTMYLRYDETSESFVRSVCGQFKSKGSISKAQVNALIKITKKIDKFGPMELPVAVREIDKPGFLNLNCKTGEVNWYSWQEFESK